MANLRHGLGLLAEWVAMVADGLGKVGPKFQGDRDAPETHPVHQVGARHARPVLEKDEGKEALDVAERTVRAGHPGALVETGVSACAQQ